MKEQIEAWVSRCQKLIDNYQKETFPTLIRPILVIMWGKKYARIVRQEAENGKVFHRSAWAFVNIENGDIFKPASWKAPAKHARGNIKDEKQGMGLMGAYGPAYLK